MEWTRQTALETLTLPVDATRDLIEETFKKLSNIYDPTQFMTKTEKFIEEIGRPTTKIECDIIFENLNSAYKYLTTMTKKLALERLRLPDNATLDLIKKTYTADYYKFYKIPEIIFELIYYLKYNLS